MDILGLHIIRPYFLLLIIPVILIFLYAIKSGKISSSWQKICDDHLLKYLSVKSAKGNRKMISVWGLIAALFAVFALTGMAINKIPVSSFSKTNPTLIALNVSSKMNVKDFSPNRLQRAKFEIIDFTKMLAEKGEFELGLMVFSDEPYMITPMSDDEKLIENIISQIDFTIMPSDGIRIDRVIDSAIEVFENNGLSYGRLIIITPEKGQKFDKALAKAKEFYGKYKSKIYVMGMSTKDGAPVMRMPHLRSSGDGEIKVSRLDADALNRIAKNGGGEFVKVMSDDSDWGKILDDGDRLLDGNMMKEMKQTACDSSKLNIQSDSIGMLHADLKKLTYKYYMGIKGFCTAEQIPELNNIFEQFFNTGGHHHGHGQGNQRQGLRRKGQGYGFGRGRNHTNNDSIN